MYYYEVLVSSPQFHGKEPLTYSHADFLPIGTIVQVPLRNKPVAGIVITSVPKPTFITKPITKVIVDEPVPTPLLQLHEWLKTYYPAPLGLHAQLLLPSSLVRKRQLPPVKRSGSEKATQILPPLSKDQQNALETIQKTKSHRTFLLHGDTGTGKTRLYTELAKETLQGGKSVLVLTPEIGLTPQLETRLKESLAAPVLTVHSDLTAVQRRNVWLQTLQTQDPTVVLGPRSALFVPLRNIGLIVIDEAHDQAYKQEQAPHYQAMRVASQLAALHNAKLVIGSATPSIQDYFIAEAKGSPIIRLTELPAGEHIERSIEVVNIRDRDHFSRQPHLSIEMLNALQKALTNKQQSLVFLNRRGTARIVACQACGWQALCPHCDLPLTYHGDSHDIRCHTCGYSSSAPHSCPVCHNPEIAYKSIGTKSLVTELQKEFPKARIQRFDTDNLKAERLEQRFAEVLNGSVDILVGTQMLTKGLDLPKLSVVGVVAADSSLSFPDYTSEERTFQLLTQIIGRVGRGHSKGTVVIQSYNPESPAIQAAIKQDWNGFYAGQITERKTYGFPPFYYALKLTCARASKKSAQTAAETLNRQLAQSGLKIKIIGPSPSFYEKLSGKYQWQIIIKSKQRQELLRVIATLPANWNYDIDPNNFL